MSNDEEDIRAAQENLGDPGRRARTSPRSKHTIVAFNIRLTNTTLRSADAADTFPRQHRGRWYKYDYLL